MRWLWLGLGALSGSVGGFLAGWVIGVRAAHAPGQPSGPGDVYAVAFAALACGVMGAVAGLIVGLVGVRLILGPVVDAPGGPSIPPSGSRPNRP